MNNIDTDKCIGTPGLRRPAQEDPYCKAELRQFLTCNKVRFQIMYGGKFHKSHHTKEKAALFHVYRKNLTTYTWVYERHLTLPMQDLVYAKNTTKRISVYGKVEKYFKKGRLFDYRVVFF